MNLVLVINKCSDIPFLHRCRSINVLFDLINIESACCESFTLYIIHKVNDIYLLIVKIRMESMYLTVIKTYEKNTKDCIHVTIYFQITKSYHITHNIIKHLKML